MKVYAVCLTVTRKFDAKTQRRSELYPTRCIRMACLFLELRQGKAVTVGPTGNASVMALWKISDIFVFFLSWQVTVRDFTMVFDAYTQFEESVLTAKMRMADVRSGRFIPFYPLENTIFKVGNSWYCLSPSRFVSDLRVRRWCAIC